MTNQKKEFKAIFKTAKCVAAMSAYTPGEQPNEPDWIKLNTNEFPYPPSPKVKEAIIAELEDGQDAKLRLYPNPESSALRKAIANYYKLEEKNVIAGNGSDDVLNLAVRAFSGFGLKIAAMKPSYSLYPVLAKIQNAEYIELGFEKNMRLPYQKIFSSGANIFFLTSPNAPTAYGFSLAEIEKLVVGFDGLVLIDEAYAPFADFSASLLVKKYNNVIVVGTTSKGWALAGMRIGWALASSEIIEILDRVRDSYNIDRLAQVAGIAALKDVKYYDKFRKQVCKTRENLEKFFDKLGWAYFKSSANFIFVSPENKGGEFGAKVAASLYESLKADKILVRYFAKDENINDFLRITIGNNDEMKAFKESVSRWIKSAQQK